MKSCFGVVIQLFLVTLLWGCRSSVVHREELNLKSISWNLRDGKDSLFLRDVDPSDVHLALLSKKLIPDPFYGTNEQQLQWIGKRSWIFTAKFDLPLGFISNKRAVLVAEGLDTYATVLINGKEILHADNMFRTWRVNVSDVLQKKNNSITITFESPDSINAIKAQRSPVPLPDNRGFTRKAAYQFGWDWGPRFVTMGVWRDLKIVQETSPEIKDLYVRTAAVTGQRAQLVVTTFIVSNEALQCVLKTFVNNHLYSTSQKLLKVGDNRFTDTLFIEQPRLWWPVGMGKQPLYGIRQQLLLHHKLHSEREVQTGIRRLELMTQKDTAGYSFYFKINGIPMFAKGANYVPQDNFLSRVSRNRYRKLLTDAKKAHINMLRVWGGGIYEKDLFYRLCDSLGILVWQDFMFAGNMVPPDRHFADNVAAEVKEQVVRLRNHPSLALWCGNNEVEEAWNNWGWQRQLQLSPSDSLLLYHSYLHIFDTIIPRLLQQYDGQTPYWRSSPSLGWGHPEAYHKGDVHYWGVWWGKQPFEAYEHHIGRFMSEYGFQGMPPVATLKQVCPDSALYLYSQCMKVHQKHPFGWENIALYMQREYPVPTTFEGYDYISQVLQAEGIATAIEAHRRAMPKCMGTLYWQLNDCWPVVSWSSIDYYGRWKALHYKVKDLYAPVVLSFEKRKTERLLYVVSDSAKPFTGTVTVHLMDFYGRILFADTITTEVLPNQVKRITVYRLPVTMDTTHVLLTAKLTANGKTLDRRCTFFAKPKNLALPQPRMRHKLIYKNDCVMLVLQSDRFVNHVLLKSNVPGHWEDNFFNLLPGEQRTVCFVPDTVPMNNLQVEITSLATVR